MASTQQAVRQPAQPHLHIAQQACPVCDQPIPNDKAEEVRARIDARDKELTSAALSRATKQFDAERLQMNAANEQILDRTRRESADALAKVMNEVTARVAVARAEGAKANEADAQDRIETLQKTFQQRETNWQDRVAAAEIERKGAIANFEKLKEQHDQTVSSRVQEAREALEKDYQGKLNAKAAAHAAETQSLTTKLADINRQLEKKTAEELGEGAEVELFDALTMEFDGDRIERVGRGNSGPDIFHTVICNGRECGTIIYDSKNTTAWRSDYVSKLVRDQTAAKADHAVLCVLKFPAEAKHLAVREGVIIINPTRAIALVTILRKHMIQVHTLRLSKNERAKKMAALYDFITSERCAHLLGRIESHADALLKMQEKEIKAHEENWKKEGTHLRSIQKVKAELEADIDRIIGTDDGSGSAT